MSRIGLVGPSYTSQSANADCQMCMNLYVENVESQLGKGAAVLYQTPGKKPLYGFGLPFTTSMATGGVQTIGAPVQCSIFTLNTIPPITVGSSLTIVDGVNTEVVTVTAVDFSQIHFFPQFTAIFRFTHSAGTIIQGFVPSAGVRGMTTVQGRTFVVAGTTLWEALPPTSTPNTIFRGSVVSDGMPVSMAGSASQLLIASATVPYVFDLTTNTFSQLSSSVLTNISQVGYSDGFFFALTANSNLINQSAVLDATQWPGLAVTKVSTFTDNVIAMFIDHRELWLFGPKAIQPYVNTGDFPFLYDAQTNAFIEHGIAAPFSVVKLDNSIIWLGADERGNGVVRRADGYRPMRISNHAIEFAIQGYSTITDAVAYSYQDQGHDFYVLSFPTAQATWVYDVATGQWHQRGFWNKQAGKFTMDRAMFHTFNFGMHLVGDPVTGSVYQMSISVYDDFGNPIRRVRRAPHISQEQQWVFHAELQIDVETAVATSTLQGNSPATFFYLSDSTGVTWQVSIDDVGVYHTVAMTGTPSILVFNDPTKTTSYQLSISPITGEFLPIPVAFNANYPQTLQMVSLSGQSNWVLGITQVQNSPPLGQVTSTFQGIVGRGPLMMMRYSNDSARSWFERESLDCGMPGEFTKRVIWRRLGRSRDRVYEISMTDPVPWRIVDAYLQASPGFVPQDRLIKQMSKQA